MGGGAAAAVGIPVVRAFITPLSKDTIRGAQGFVPVLPVVMLPADGTPVQAEVVVRDPRDAWAKLPPTQVGAVLLRKDGEEIRAFSTVCPHLGCGVSYKPKESAFACPCHESAFTLEGTAKLGPSPRGLDALETRVRSGNIEVRYRLFRTGLAEKVPV